jgi:hypothetical protein
MLRDDVFELMADPPVAHALFFADRHSNEDAPFHKSIEEDWHSSIPNVLTMAFRGSAKSTKAEEAITLEVCFQRVKNVLILGESEQRAVERLTAIKHHLEYDEALQSAFAVGPGDPWAETRACTSTGIMIQAYGRGQSLRGVKHLDARPDFIFLDDIEDKESGSVATPEARKKTRSWLAGTVIPALAPGGRMRMGATPLHPEALAPTLAKADQSWTTRTYPIIYRSADTGEWVSAWPDRFPLEEVLRLWDSFKELGQEEDFFQEYLCRAVDPASQVFTQEMFVIEPRSRSYHAVYAIYDPARTTNKQSATTGKAVASWIGNRLVVWESTAKKWMPDEIVNDIFATSARYSPVAVGVEQDGLNEWLLQPIRSRQVAEGCVIPLRPLKAPKGKLDFIKGLQDYFARRAVIFSTPLPELQAQLIGFPNGLIDAPNALAYMLTMKMGAPIYDNFTDAHATSDDGDLRMGGSGSDHACLLVNTNNQITTGMLVQLRAGRLLILWDAIVDGDAGTALTDLLQEAMLHLAGLDPAVSAEAQRLSPALRLHASPRHFDEYSVYGLRAAARKALAPGNSVTQTADLIRGGDPVHGREEIRALLRRLSHGRPALAIFPAATWTLRAFAGGYARNVNEVEPIDNAYAVLMEPLEAFAARLRSPVNDLVEQANYAYTVDGRRYLSAIARR